MTDADVSIAQIKQPKSVVPRAEQARRTRALIVNTGIQCLASHGFANTTMLLISREAGVSRGPLHYHFADRNELMAAIAEALPRGVSKKLMKRLMDQKTLEARIETLIDIALSEHLGPHHFAAMELLLAARNDPKLAKAIQPYFLESETLSDDWWTDYFSMLRWTPKRLVAFRHVAVACLRGLALDYLLHGNAKAHSNALELFREMFISFGRASSSDD